MRASSESFPTRAEIRGLVRSLGPTTLFDLFEGYDVAEENRFDLLEETLAVLVVSGRQDRDLRLRFLEALEDRCQRYAKRPGPYDGFST